MSPKQEHPETGSEDSVDFSANPWKERARELLRRKAEEDKQRALRRREGRKVGDLSDGLVEKLRSCNPPQLRRVKRLCNEFLADHRHPPHKNECASYLTEEALFSWVVKNRRYQLEMRNCGKKCGGCPHGPYLYVYQRDGSLIKPKYLKRPDWRKRLPRKIRKDVVAYYDSFKQRKNEAELSRRAV
ncbi:MAG: hypothetical protein WCD04_06670 [Terriglobia bacterium]